ncbi:protein-transmembrane prediction [Rubritalea sp.]|uniref:protein-transmembrane prediction n=1 Tax=Rubritalea sp. TaxID=2109375 RepID=UPI003EF84193
MNTISPPINKFRMRSLLQLLAILFSLLALTSWLEAQTKRRVASLEELQEVVKQSDQAIVMKPGSYNLTDLPEKTRVLECSGSENTIDLTGVHLIAQVGATRRGYIRISGDENVFRGLTVEDVYQSGLKEVADFSAYNQDRSNLARGLKGEAVLAVTGDNNTIKDTKLTVRGSFPFGYGSIYGIGSDNVFGLDKRCGIQIRGENNLVEGCEVQQRAFGHGIYIQEPSDNTTVRDCLVEGVMRASEELYKETDPNDLPVRSRYKLPLSEDKPIPKDIMLPLSEDGIRVYNRGGSVLVENCTVKKMRGGIRVYLASKALVKNSVAVDCGHTNFNLPKGGKVFASSGNFAYAPLSDFRLSRSGQKIELTVLPSPHAIGSHNLADVLGNNHSIILRRSPGPIDTNLRPIVVEGDNSTIRNETEYPIILEKSSSGNTVTSFGPVTDHGEDNDVSQIKGALKTR